MTYDLTPLLLSLKLATVTTVILFAVGVPLAYWLSRSRSWFRLPVQVLVTMPLVLPPTVLGFYLLLGLSPASFLGHLFLKYLHLRLVFSFTGIAIGSVIFSLPFMVNSVLAGFEGLPPSLAEASQVLGKTERQTLFHVLLPNIKPALFTGLALTFAHTMGEFGVVLMIGGKIPGVTRVASMAIYDEVEAMNYSAAHLYAGILFTVSFAFLLLLFFVNRRFYRGIQ
ncbi:MAG: molybdate ABC transporter permease subunit [Fibrobacterota bacterium]